MRFKDLLNESDWGFGLDILDFGLRPPARRGHRGLRPGGILDWGFFVSLAQRKRLRRVSPYHFLIKLRNLSPLGLRLGEPGQSACISFKE
jgi:hypothetical protein